MICSLGSRLDDNFSLVDSVRDLLRQDMDCDFDVYLKSIFTAVRNRTVGFRFATYSVVEMQSATLCQDSSPSLRF